MVVGILGMPLGITLPFSVDVVSAAAMDFFCH